MPEEIRLLQFPLGYLCLGTKEFGGQLKISECNDLLRVFSVHVALPWLLRALQTLWAGAGNADCSSPLHCLFPVQLLHAQLLWAIGPSVYLDVEIFLPTIPFFITFLGAFHYLYKQVPWKLAGNMGSQYWKKLIVLLPYQRNADGKYETTHAAQLLRLSFPLRKPSLQDGSVILLRYWNTFFAVVLTLPK